MGTKGKEITLAAFREMDSKSRVRLFRDDPLRFRALTEQVRNEAVASLTAVTALLRETQDGPVVVTLGPVNLPWNALLWQVDPQTRLNVEQAAQALNVTIDAVYGLVAKGSLPRLKLNGRLSFRADVLRTYIREHEL